MRALETARRACPAIWFRGVGIVAAIEARAMATVTKAGEGYEKAARALGREMGGAGADLKRRKHHMTFGLADFLTRCEPKAPLAVREAIWDEGLFLSMQAILTSDSQQSLSFDLVRGPISNKSAWRRYKRRYQEMDQYKGNV